MTLVLVNKQIPTQAVLAKLMEDTSPDSCVVKEWGDYEGNIEFEPLILTYGDTEIVFCGYNGLHEMLSYNSLSSDAKIGFSNDMFDWIVFNWDFIDTLEDIKAAYPNLLA